MNELDACRQVTTIVVIVILLHCAGAIVGQSRPTSIAAISRHCYGRRSVGHDHQSRFTGQE